MIKNEGVRGVFIVLYSRFKSCLTSVPAINGAGGDSEQVELIRGRKTTGHFLKTPLDGLLAIIFGPGL
jgi:hypothetical protein